MTASTFSSAIAYVFAHEGGYVNNRRDKGGPTNLGITQATLSAWRGTEATIAEVKALTRAEATAIYRAEYWARVHADALPVGLDYAMFDFAVNSGVGRAGRFLQTLLKARKVYAGDIDGVLGAKTLQALSQIRDMQRLVRDLQAMRLKYLKTLDNWATFGTGWSRRVAEVQAAALTLCSTGNHALAFASLPDPVPPVRGAVVAPSRTLPGRAAIVAAVSAVGEKASEYAQTIQGLQDIAPVFKWAFAAFTVLGIIAGLAKAIELAQGAEPSAGKAASRPEDEAYVPPAPAEDPVEPEPEPEVALPPEPVEAPAPVPVAAIVAPAVVRTPSNHADAADAAAVATALAVQAS